MALVYTLTWTAYWAILVLLGVYAGHRLFLIGLYWSTARDLRVTRSPPPLPDELPTVTVQLPLFNEMYVAARLIDAVAALDWPIDRLQIQVLDDSTDETSDICRERARSLTALGYDVEHLHRTDRTGFKAGALEAGLASAKGDYILILDADFVPPSSLLRETVGHLCGDPDLGMVQVRWEHLNRRSNALTRVQALLLDGHFVVEQSVRARTGRFFNFNGTAGLWRRQAIIDAGGWQHDTLTEDLDLSYRALLRGWRFEYLLGRSAPAELPADVNGFKSQQFRWAKGSVQVARKLLFSLLRADVPARVKIDGFFHLTQNVPYLLTLTLVLLSVPALALRPAGPSEFLWLHLPASLVTLATLGAYCVTSQRALTHDPWWALAQVPMLIAVTVGICVNQSRAVIEGALGKPSEFVRTPKHGLTDRSEGRAGSAGEGPHRAHRWRAMKYRGVRDLIPIAELAMGLYMGFALLLMTLEQRFWGLPFFFLLALGFTYIGVGSVLRR